MLIGRGAGLIRVATSPLDRSSYLRGRDEEWMHVSFSVARDAEPLQRPEDPSSATMSPVSRSEIPPPYYFIDPYNYEFLTPISFASTRFNAPAEKNESNKTDPAKDRNIFSRIFKSAKDSGEMGLFADQDKYQGYEKALDLEAGDASSSQADSTETSSTTSSERSKSKIDARVISDAIIGLSDGMTVPFALTAGLSAIGDTRVVIFGGFAELFAGAISMGLGGYLVAKSEA